ncbi:MAG: F0F1 ATP synthase subunit B [Dehalococcoidales bacterium]|nr:F0F1 ATP synthase subunit B [Dehalococcoidales bacterium]
MENGLSSLGVDLPVLLSQIISFLVLFGLLYLVAYKPMMRMLDERSSRVKESMDQTEQIKEQAALAEKETAKRIRDASKEGQKLVDRAMQAGEEMKLKAKDEAKKEAETLMNRARTEIERERDDAIGELRSEFADLTILAAEKVINRSLDKKTHRQLIDKVLEESTTENKN